MSAKRPTAHLSRLAVLAEEADEAVREAVGDDRAAAHPAIDDPVVADRATNDAPSEPATRAQSPIDDLPAVNPTIEGIRSDNSGDDLIAMASGLDIGLDAEPEPTSALRSDEETEPCPAPPTTSDASSMVSLRAVFCAALMGLLAVGTFAITQGGRVTIDATANSTNSGIEPDAEQGASGLATPVRAALRIDDAAVDVDLRATVGITSDDVVATTAWELVGSEPGTAMIADVIDSEWLRTTFEQTLTETGEPVAFTFFSPSDASLAALGTTGLNELVADPAIGREFINSHIVDVRLTEAELRSRAGTTLTSRAGNTILVTVEGQDVALNGHTLIFPSLVASNGTVIIIDDVLHRP